MPAGIALSGEVIRIVVVRVAVAEFLSIRLILKMVKVLDMLTMGEMGSIEPFGMLAEGLVAGYFGGNYNRLCDYCW